MTERMKKMLRYKGCSNGLCYIESIESGKELGFDYNSLMKLLEIGNIEGISNDGKCEYKTGQVYGDNMLVLPIKASHGKWICQCTKCKKLREIKVASFKMNRYLNCEFCNPYVKKGICIHKKGETYGDMVLIEKQRNTRNWKCECIKCGKTYYKNVSHLINGYGNKCDICSGKQFGNRNIHQSKEIYGDFELIEYIPNSHGHWVCKCIHCNTETTKLVYNLVSGESDICRVCNPVANGADIKVGDIIGDLEIIRYTHRSIWECKCSKCGFIQERTAGKLRDYIDVGCYICNPNENKGARSSYEKILRERYVGAITNNRSILGGKELDLYYPDIKVAIEFNGDMWHNDLNKNKYYHRDKTMECINKGIRLIHIFEYEWLDNNKKNKILDTLDNVFGLIPIRKIHARKTCIKEVDSKEAKVFLDENHLQGNISSVVNIGLYQENVLIGLMTFGYPRFSKSYEYELLRLAFKKGTIVTGGSEKMFKYFLNSYNPKSIISYCNIAKFSGNVYNRLGFKLDGYTEPNYVWVNIHNHKAMSRYKTTRKNLIETYGLDDKDRSITEDSIMRSMDYCKIYDSGNARYIWKREE